MQLNELIEQEGIRKVTLKTNISERNLNYLVDEKFEKLTRVKALGFLVILEREYKEFNLENLRSNIKVYFHENQPDTDNVMVLKQEKETSGEVSLFKWFVILGLLGAAWYFYDKGEFDGLLKNVKKKETLFDDKKALDVNVSEEEAERLVVHSNEQDAIEIVRPTAKIIEVVSDKDMSTLEVNDSIVAATMVAITELDSNASEAKIAEIASFKVEPAIDANSENVDIVATAITTITINPTKSMLWYGFINLDTKKRHEFMKKVSTPFDLKGARYLLVTGHGYVDIVSELKTVEVADRNKHYFYIDSTEITEISKKNFREMNGRRGW